MLIYPRHLFTDRNFLTQGWSAWLSGEGPLNLEIGCGYGHFLIKMASQFPEQRFIGLDLVNKILVQVARQLERAGLHNACVCKLDAVLALRELFLDRSLDNLYILFPDPWFKERRLKRRILRADTLPEMLRVLKPGGHLHFVTDDADYAQDAQALLSSCQGLKAAPFPELEISTKYERKWREQEKEIYCFCYQRLSERAVTASWPDLSQPLQFQFPDWSPEHSQAFWRAFKPRQQMRSQWVLKLMACYYDPTVHSLLLRCLFSETGALALAFWLEISARGQLTLAPGSYLPRLRQRQQLLEEIASLIQTGQG